MAGYGYRTRGYNTHHEMEPHVDDDWKKTGYGDERSRSDHVCRPVIVDAEGRKHPVIIYTPNNPDGYFTKKTEGTHHHVHAPIVAPEHSRSPARTGFLSTTNWRSNPPHSTGYRAATDGYGEYGNFRNSEWNKTGGGGGGGGGGTGDDKFEGYHRSKKDDWNLSGATNDIDKAMELLKDAAVSSPAATAAAPRRWNAPGDSSAYKKEGYVETIDSREAAKRYGNFRFGARPYKGADESYTGTIDSREAMRKYGGSFF